MRVGNYSSGAARLHEAVRSLEAAWAEARSRWNDSTSRALEENHIIPMCDQVKALIEATARLAEVVGNAARECEPREETY